MKEFSYSGRNQQYQPVSGKRAASSAEELAQVLQKEGILPLEIVEDTVREPLFSYTFEQKVKPVQLQLLCRQLYTLLKAGIPIAMSMQKLSETTNHPHLAKVLQEVIQLLNQGKTLTEGLRQFPKIFNELFVSVVKIGESTGQLDIVFLHLSQYLELEIETTKKIKSALRYPVIVISVTLIALLIINAFVIPNFAKLFASFKGELPLPTKILMASSDFILDYWWLIFALFLGAITSFSFYIRTISGKLRWHHAILKLPIVGSIVHRMYLARFCRLYALMLKSGLSAVDSIIIVGHATGNAYIAHKIGGISDMVARGNTISSSCDDTKLFSPLVIQMLALGEETGNIDDMLEEVGQFYEREVDYDLARISELIEPILLVMMAGMVLVLAFGVFLPMWDMVNLN